MAVYATLSEFKSWVRLSVEDVLDDTEASVALSAAEAQIDSYCGRVFTKATDATARRFDIWNPDVAWIDDFWSTSGLVVEVDEGATGVYTTWAITDYEVEPINGRIEGREFAYTRLRAIDSRRFIEASTGRRNLLRVTAKWGWPSVPADVKLATLILANRLLRRREAPMGILEFMGGDALRVSAYDGDVRNLLAPFRKADRFVIG